MADPNLLCIDIHEDQAVALAVETGQGGATVVHGTGKNDLEATPLPALIEGLKDQTGFVSGASRVALGAELFSYRTLSLPFNDKNKIDKVLPLELAEVSPVSVDNLIIDFVISKSTPEGADILAATMDKEVFTECLASLNSTGVDPEIVTISGVEEAHILAKGESKDFVLIDVGTNWATVIVVVEGSIALIRSISTPPEIFATDTELRSTDFALDIKQTLLVSGFYDIHDKNSTVFIMGHLSPYVEFAEVLSSTLEGARVKTYLQSKQPLIKIEPAAEKSYLPEAMDRALALAIRSSRQRGFNFRKGDFKKRKTSGDLRSIILKFGLPVIVLLLAAAGYWGYSFHNLQQQQQALKNEIEGVFKNTLPEVTRIVNPIQQLSVKNQEIQTTYRPGGISGSDLTVIELLAELSNRIPETYEVTFVRFVADMNVIRIKAVTQDFNTVDNVQKELEKSPHFQSVSISSANQSPKGDEVSFELKIERT